MKSISNKAHTGISISLMSLSLMGCASEDDAADKTGEDVELEISLGDGENSSTSVSTSTVNGKSTTSVSTSNGNSSSASSSSSTSDGKFSLKADGVDINIDLPQSLLKKSQQSDDLYPGSKILGVDINSESKNNNGSSDSKAVVYLKFFAPDEPQKVAQYFADKFKDEGGSASLSGTSVSGKTKDGQDYKLTLDADGNGSRGLLKITGNKG